MEGGDTANGLLGNDALLFRYSMPLARESWDLGAYTVTTKITLLYGTNTSYKVRLSRVSSDCGETYQVLGELGPFSGPVNGKLLAFTFNNVSSFRDSTTDRIAVDFISSGTGWYSFGTSYGHAEHLFAPFSACTPVPTKTPKSNTR